MPIRIGIVDYANVAPLVDGLNPRPVRAVPSKLAEAMRSCDIDLGLLPSIELGRMAGAKALPTWGIAADGPCLSVLLFTKKPLGSIRSVALDSDSLTSQALTRILLDRAGAEEVEWTQRKGGSVADRLDSVDATLLIGDPALRAEAPAGVEVVDLADEWKRVTGKPFVFACWTIRPGYELSDTMRDQLDAAAERGMARFPELAAAESARTGIPAERLERYFETLVYRLREPHLQGLHSFLDEAWRVGVLPARPQLRLA